MFHVKHSASEPPEHPDAYFYARAIRLLAVRARSEGELRARLLRAGAQEEVIIGVITRLRGAGLLDDEAFAQAWVQSRSRSSPRGERLLRHELRQRGLNDELVEQTLSSADDGDAATRAAAKKARALQAETDDAFTRKLGAFLARRGFPYEIVSSTVAALLAERRQSRTDPNREA